MLPLRNPVPITAFVVPLGDPSRASIHTGLPFWLPNFSHKKTVTHVPGLFCNLCPRNVPFPSRDREGAVLKISFFPNLLGHLANPLLLGYRYCGILLSASDRL